MSIITIRCCCTKLDVALRGKYLTWYHYNIFGICVFGRQGTITQNSSKLVNQCLCNLANMIKTLMYNPCHIFLNEKEKAKVNSVELRRQLLIPFVPEMNTTRTVAYLYFQ